MTRKEYKFTVAPSRLQTVIKETTSQTKKKVNYGDGLFSNQDIPNNTRILFFQGCLINLVEKNRIKPRRSGYIIQINHNLFLDCFSRANNSQRCMCLASKANSPSGTTSNANCRLVVDKKRRRCSLLTTRAIGDDEEILYSYNGKLYDM